MAARPVVRSMNPGPAPRPGPDRLVTDTPNTALQIESVGALKFFPRVKLHEPAVALPVSSDMSGERAAELGHRDNPIPWQSESRMST